jgi:hypothetical protein
MSSVVSVRLGPEALRALAHIESTGVSRSRAIRDSASRLRRRDALAAEVALLGADEDDRREMIDVADFMAACVPRGDIHEFFSQEGTAMSRTAGSTT